MALTLRSNLSRNLTPAEVDANFQFLQDAITALQNGGSGTKPIARIFAEHGQSNKVDKSKTSEAALITALAGINNVHNNLLNWVPTSVSQRDTGSFQAVQNGVNDLSCSDPMDCGLNGALGGSPYPPQRGTRAGAQALRLAELFPGEVFRRVTYGTNGQSWTTILDGGVYAADHDARWDAAKANVVAAGYTWKLISDLIIYGEEDFSRNNPFADLANAHVARQLQKGYSDSDTVTIIVGLKDSDGVDKSSYRTQMQAWCAANPAKRKYIDPADFQGNSDSGDNIHLNAATQAQIGNSDFPNATFGTTGGFRIAGSSMAETPVEETDAGWAYTPADHAEVPGNFRPYSAANASGGSLYYVSPGFNASAERDFKGDRLKIYTPDIAAISPVKYQVYVDNVLKATVQYSYQNLTGLPTRLDISGLGGGTHHLRLDVLASDNAWLPLDLIGVFGPQ